MTYSIQTENCLKAVRARSRGAHQVPLLRLMGGEWSDPLFSAAETKGGSTSLAVTV
jgi:hypothetical protein